VWVPFLTWGSGGYLVVELLDETPLVPVVVRYDPDICGPDVAHWARS
jgi:hypothetical protein